MFANEMGLRLSGTQSWIPAVPGRLIMTTPLTPAEIADEMRPFLIGESGQLTSDQILYGRLHPDGMFLQLPGLHGPDHPGIQIEFEQQEGCTLLSGALDQTYFDRAWLLAIIVAFGGVLLFLAITYRSPATVGGFVGASLAILAIYLLMQLLRHKQMLACYRQILMYVLMAEDQEANT